MSKLTSDFARIIEEKVETAAKQESEHIDTAAKMFNDCVEAGHKIYFFGTGHSYMTGQEVFGRAGGYAGFVPILENELSMNHIIKSTYIERIPEYATVIMGLYDFQKDDVVVMTSNSGRNGLVVEMALKFKEKGLKIIAITAMNNQAKIKSRHASGKKLCNLADLCLNNESDYGDVSLTHSDGTQTGPTSTIMDCFLIDAVVSNFVDLQIKEHGSAPVFISSNVDAGDKHNIELFKK